MTRQSLLIVLLTIISLTVGAQELSATEYLKKINKELPHQFREIKTGATMEVVRDHSVIRIYMLVDDIEQYEELLVERSDETQSNYAQCKSITILKGKYPKNYVEVVDQYPQSVKMAGMYRLKAITSEGILKMFAPVNIMDKSQIATPSK